MIKGQIHIKTATMQELILIVDPRILHIPIKNTGAKMLNLIDQATLLYGPSPEIPNNTDYTKVRKTVYEKIFQAQKLLPKGIRFCLYEGYRSLNLQKPLFDNQFSRIQ